MMTIIYIQMVQEKKYIYTYRESREIKCGKKYSHLMNLVGGVLLYYSFNLSSGLKFFKIKSFFNGFLF